MDHDAAIAIGPPEATWGLIAYEAVFHTKPVIRERLLIEEVAELFVEMRPFLGTCNFDDCSHTHEPKCPIRAAVEDNAIAGSRYDAYKELLAEAKAGHL